MEYAHPTAGPWSSDELGILRTRVSNGGTRNAICEDVSKIIGRSPKAISTKMYVEGMRDDSERRYHASLVTTNTAGGPPLDLGAGDDRYVKACLAQGGFIYRTRLPNGQYVEVRP